LPLGGSTPSVIFPVELYRYSVDGIAPPGFVREDVAAAFPRR
jgi:hypothetical protein